MARKAENGITASNINQTYGWQGSFMVSVQALAVAATEVKQVDKIPYY